MIGLALWLKIDMVLGAFFAGIFISSFFRHKIDLYNKLLSLCFGFFAPIFFVYVGSTLDISLFFVPDVFEKSLLIIGLLVGMRVIASFVAFYSALKLKNTILFALSDSMPLTFMVAVATIGVNANAISKYEYFSIILASMMDAVVIMTTIKILFNLFESKKNKQISS
jgi:Kef-type K+ transport system membrane component KefB